MTVEEVVTEALKAVWDYVSYERVLFENPEDDDQVFHSWLVTDRPDGTGAARFAVSDVYLEYMDDVEMVTTHIPEGKDMLEAMKQRNAEYAV